MSDVGDPSYVDGKKNRFQLEKEGNEEYLRSTLESYKGRACLWNFLQICGMYDRGYTGDNRAYYNEGKRDVGLTIKSDIETVAPNAFVKMMMEASERENVKDGR